MSDIPVFINVGQNCLEIHMLLVAKLVNKKQ